MTGNGKDVSLKQAKSFNNQRSCSLVKGPVMNSRCFCVVVYGVTPLCYPPVIDGFSPTLLGLKLRPISHGG